MGEGFRGGGGGRGRFFGFVPGEGAKRRGKLIEDKGTVGGRW